MLWPQFYHHLLGCTFSTVTLFDSKHQGGQCYLSLFMFLLASTHRCVTLIFCGDDLVSPGTNSQEARQRAVAHIWHRLHSLIADCALITSSLSYGNSGRKRCLAVAIHLARSSRNGRQVVGSQWTSSVAPGHRYVSSRASSLASCKPAYWQGAQQCEIKAAPLTSLILSVKHRPVPWQEI